MQTHTKNLVLIGGGHTHVLLIRAFGLKPIDDVKVTLISEKVLTPYSGMLPGYVAGHYTLEQTNIDLQKLCKKSNVSWLEAHVNGINIEEQKINCCNGRIVEFDKCSLDIGSTPDLSIEGAQEFALGVKPISGFQQRWHDLLALAGKDELAGDWGIVGAGAGGVELVLAMAHRLRHNKNLTFHLIFRGQQVLSSYPQNVIRNVERALSELNIKLHNNFAVKAVTAEGVIATTGEKLDLMQSVWCTGAKGSDWLNHTTLGLTSKKFIEVNQFLQSTSHSNIFATGDIAEMINDPRPKAGVYAVRQAPMLEQNLRLAFSGQALEPIKLQTQFLSLLSLGDKVAVASRNGFAVKGHWVWRWKNYIDVKFMKLFV